MAVASLLIYAEHSVTSTVAFQKSLNVRKSDIFMSVTYTASPCNWLDLTVSLLN